MSKFSQTHLVFFLLFMLCVMQNMQKTVTFRKDITNKVRSGGGVVDHELDYQSRDHKIDPPLLRSFGLDFTPRSRLRMTSLLVVR